VQRVAGISLLLVLASVAVPRVAAQQPSLKAAQSGEQQNIRGLLDTIRNYLVQLEFENAVAAVDEALAEPARTDAERGELLILRSQAHVAAGNLAGAEQDYREILALRPDYAPDSRLTPRKAMQRFEKVQAVLVGRVLIETDPPGALLRLDGRELEATPENLLWLLTGSYELRAESPGFDPGVTTVEVVANEQVEIKLELVPNARSVILRTEPEGVEVVLDGTVVGLTARRPGSAMQPAELIVEHVPLGEHEFELRKECFRSERRQDILTVDLLDRSPKRYEAVALAPVRSVLALSEGPAGAEVRLDGSFLGRLPFEPREVCPGARRLEVSFAQRLIWRSTVELRDSVDETVRIDPRPNLVLLGDSDGEWPPELAEFAGQFNTAEPQALPRGHDFNDAAGWDRVTLPEDIDLALAVVPTGRAGSRDRWLLYSPILGSVVHLDVAPTLGPRPTWRKPVWGVTVVDSRLAGPAVVIEVVEGGAAAAAGLAVGDRIESLGGRAVTTATEIEATLAVASADRPIEIAWIRGTEQHKANLQGRWSPRLLIGPDSEEQAMLRAAWALVDSICAGEWAPAALANLGLLLSDYEHHQLAADSWRRVRWGKRQGIGEGTSAYYLGRELELLGRENDAVAAYTRAVSSVSTTFDDDGPRVAPAARDRLADLGRAASR
jgi:tetratricopeptide (TPR) repeat protein